MSGNILRLLQLQWEAKTWKLAAFLLPIGIVCLLVGNLMAHDLIQIFGYPCPNLPPQKRALICESL